MTLALASPEAKTAALAESPCSVRAHAIPHDIKALTSVRFFAAMWVAIFHLKPELGKLAPPLRPVLELFSHGHFAVPFFFILSGFILTHSYFPCYSLRSHWHFMVLRLARIWPVHCATLLIFIAYDAAHIWWTGNNSPDSPYPLAALPAEIGMIRCWFEKDLVWNYPAWSIHAEWFAYLFIFPLAFILLRRADRPVLLGVLVAALLVGHSFLPTELLPGKGFDILLPFLSGVALYRLRIFLPTAPGKIALYAGVGFLVWATCLGHEGGVLYGSFALIVLGLSYPSFLTRILSDQRLVYGGTISYSLYMTHALVQKFTDEIIKRFPPEPARMHLVSFVLVIAAVLLTAVATYHFVEAPCNKRLRNWARQRFPHSLGHA